MPGRRRLISGTTRPMAPRQQQLTPVFTLGGGCLSAIRGDSRWYPRPAHPGRPELRRRPPAHAEPALLPGRCRRQAPAWTALCRSREKLVGVLSLEHAETTPIGDGTLQLVRHCAQLLGHWQPGARGDGVSAHPLSRRTGQQDR